jgi:hypothetical protein
VGGRRVLFLVTVLVFFLAGNGSRARAGGAANPGFTGLWEYPTAETPEDGAGRFGLAWASPYAFYYVDLAWLPWLEVNARLSTFDNIHVTPRNRINDRGDGRRYMDKAIDLKVMLHRSREWRVPSLALGVTDVMGTELMKAWYGVATWRFDRLAASLGYGTDRMNGLFGGVSWETLPWLTLKAEYSPMDYTLDRAGGLKPHPNAAKARYNVGAALSAPWGTELTLSYQRGEEFVVSLSHRFNLKGTFLSGKGRNTAYEAPGAARIAEWEDVDLKKLCGEIADALSRFVRARDVEVAAGEKKIYVAYENYGHSSQAEAMVRVLVVLAALSPHLDEVTLIPKARGVPVVRAEFPGEVLFGIRARDLTAKDPWQETRFLWTEKKFFDDLEKEGKLLYRSERSQRNRASHEFKAMAVYEPRVDQTLDDDYQSRWSVDFVYERRSSDGWGAVADVRVPVWSDVDIYWEPDVTQKTRLHRAAVGLLEKIRDGDWLQIWTVSEAGWLDKRHFGLNHWQRVYSRDGRWWVGPRLGFARDRDPRSFSGLARGRIDYAAEGIDDDSFPWRLGLWAQGGYFAPDLGLDLQVDAGRFLDEDVGVRASAIRRWDGAALGFWLFYTRRSSEALTNAGIHLELPAERWFGSWFGNPSAHIWEQEMPLPSTWTVDAGRMPGKWRDPERLLSQLRPVELKKNVKNLLEEFCSFEASEPNEQGKYGLTDYLLR